MSVPMSTVSKYKPTLPGQLLGCCEMRTFRGSLVSAQTQPEGVVLSSGTTSFSTSSDEPYGLFTQENVLLIAEQDCFVERFAIRLVGTPQVSAHQDMKLVAWHDGAGSGHDISDPSLLVRTLKNPTTGVITTYAPTPDVMPYDTFLEFGLLDDELKAKRAGSTGYNFLAAGSALVFDLGQEIIEGTTSIEWLLRVTRARA